MRPSIVFGCAVNKAGSMVNRVSSTNSVMRFSVGPIIVSGGGKAVNGAVVEVPIEINDDADEQCGLDANIELLVLGRGERRACCNCDFEGKFDNRTLFLHSKSSQL